MNVLKVLFIVLFLLGAVFPAEARFEKREAILYLPGKYNFATQRAYPEFNAMLNIIDIGHGQLAEILMTEKNETKAIQLIEEELFNQVTRMFLGQQKRPRFSPSEETIAPESVKLAWKVNKAFDWTHLLHRQVYDILSDDRIKDKDKMVLEALAYYRTEPQRVFPMDLKSMDLMEKQPFSGYWRKSYPKFNGAIWAYHWLQLVANEALVEPDPQLRREKLDLGVREFKQMFADPSRLPKHMPMAHEVSPTFAARFPEVAATFDNLHTFHDIYMDLLTDPSVLDKKKEAYRQLALMMDPQSNLEEMPSRSLPPIPLEDQQPLLQLNQKEHMGMMMMPADEQLQFLKMSPQERKEKSDRLNNHHHE
jgi:hypothetical protein